MLLLQLFAFLRRWSLACAAVLANLLLAVPALADAAHPNDAPGFEVGLKPPELPGDFKVIERGWIRLGYHVAEAAWVEPLLAEAEAFRAELTNRLGRSVLNHVEVRLARDARSMKDHAPIGAPYPPYAAGVAYSRIGLILLHTDVDPNNTSSEPLKETFRHELAHVALFDATGGTPVPLWFNEGVAIHLSRENAFARTQALWLATVSGKLLPVSSLEQNFPSDSVGVSLAYAQSADLLRFLLRKEDRSRFASLMNRMDRGQPFDAALRDAYGMDQYSLEQLWRADIESRYTIWPMLLGGSATSVFTLVLVGLAWRRKKQREQVAYRRWDHEEAAVHARRLRALGAHLRLVTPFRTFGADTAASEPPALNLGAANSEAPNSEAAPAMQRDSEANGLSDNAFARAKDAVAATTLDAPPVNSAPNDDRYPPGDKPLAHARAHLHVVTSNVPKVNHDGRWHTVH